jgi:hypothetical protein
MGGMPQRTGFSDAPFAADLSVMRPRHSPAEPAVRVRLKTCIPALLLLGLDPLPAHSAAPECLPTAGRLAEPIHGEVDRGKAFTASTPSGWLLRLAPTEYGWFLQVSLKERRSEDLSRLTPPWHFVPNPRELEGWHFRNIDNTGPNDGSVNAPYELREFIFSPEVGRSVDHHGSEPSSEDVARVRDFGRGWLYVLDYRLTPPRAGDRAAFESLTFAACLTWPSKAAESVPREAKP